MRPNKYLEHDPEKLQTFRRGLALSTGRIWEQCARQVVWAAEK